MGNVRASCRSPSSHWQDQILFLIGLVLIIGYQKTFIFFARRQKLKGTAAFAAGITLILLRWTLIGFAIELYGIFVLFGDFFATIGSFAGNIPVVGPYIQMALQSISSGRRNAELPVWDWGWSNEVGWKMFWQKLERLEHMRHASTKNWEGDILTM
jgi:hypothetical protein